MGAGIGSLPASACSDTVRIALASRRGIFLLTGRHDLQETIRQWPLKVLGFIPGGAHGDLCHEGTLRRHTHRHSPELSDRSSPMSEPKLAGRNSDIVDRGASY